jgi:hypothetical protein
MIINISERTDIVNHYSTWLFKRFEESYALSRNSLSPNSVRHYELTPDKQYSNIPIKRQDLPCKFCRFFSFRACFSKISFTFAPLKTCGKCR